MDATDESAAGAGGSPDADWLQRTLTAAIAALQDGRPAEAVAPLEAVVRVAPDFPFAHRLLADAKRERRDFAAAEAGYRTALALDPGVRDAKRGLALVLAAQGRLEEAAEAADRAMAEDPDAWAVLLALGNAQHAAGQHEAAIDSFMRIPPDRERGLAMAQANIGVVLRDLGRDAEAVVCFRAALALAPDRGDIRRNLIVMLYTLGDQAGAAAEVRAWREHDPDNPVARHMAASLAGEPAPETASEAYLRTMFDGQAATFDADLSRVGYQAPPLIAEALRGALPPGAAPDILDVGCGTGLMAPELRPFTRRLIGVDLSPRMLEQARARSLYDGLELCGALDYMAAHPAGFDAVTAGDVLMYVGETAPWAAAFAIVLRPGGWVAFNIETHDDALPWRLQASGRYSHAVAPLCATLRAAGLAVVAVRPFTVRMERGRPVPAAVLLARNGGQDHPNP